jgi:hypothetical protein
MTRAHFELIARAVRDARPSCMPGATSGQVELHSAYNDQIDNVAHELASSLSGTNSMFDSQKFLAACGVQP